ncbi:GDP-mannose 4,6-dehydratase [Rosistilla oblonga]|uniref:GDP-mannose 4,6-dehydratase n=1 Tax=Rosistilla oblonga TaxID=2527990 RepID=UPI003A970579
MTQPTSASSLFQQFTSPGSHVDRSIDRPGQFIQRNGNLLQGILTRYRMLPAVAVQQFRFQHVSTDKVYGSLSKTGLSTETMPYGPRSPELASKALPDQHSSNMGGHLRPSSPGSKLQ